MRKKKDNKSQQSASGQQSPLALLAATCSKLEETGESSGKNQANNVQQTLKVINSSQVINATDLAQYMQLAGPGQTVGIVNADGTITQITNSQMAGGSASGQMKPVTSIASQSQITQLAQAGQLGSGGVAYSIIPAQQVQNIQIDGQDALYIPASSFGTTGQQTFQIAGTNQIFTQQATSQPNQTVVRTGAGQSTSSTPQTAVIQGVQGLNNMAQLTQLTGGQVALTRSGNMMQTLQLPVNSLPQTIQVQMPIQTQNGQVIYHTMQMPLSSLPALTGGQQVVQQMPQQIQMAQIQLPQQTGTGKDGSLDASANSQSQVNSNAQQATNQNVIATINLPNGQLGQIISPQSVWPANALNLSNLTG